MSQGGNEADMAEDAPKAYRFHSLLPKVQNHGERLSLSSWRRCLPVVKEVSGCGIHKSLPMLWWTLS